MADKPEGQSCSNCRYYQMRSRNVGPEGNVLYQDSEMTCKRHPPIVLVVRSRTVCSWPEVDPWQWCGEFIHANPETISEGAATMARLIQIGDLSAARALADYLKEGGS